MRRQRFSRRTVLKSMVGLLASPTALAQMRSGERQPAQPQQFAPVVPGYAIRFPHDEGSHPDFRIEWWYVTGWLQSGKTELGFQITFFRTRLAAQLNNPSAFAPRQMLIAHAALSDPAYGRLIHTQRAARAAFDLAGAAEGDLHVWLDDWSLRREKGNYLARIADKELSLDLRFTPVQQPLLQGDAGLSRKGPRPESASYYYSLPQLQVEGNVATGGKSRAAQGSAWFDHEWSSSYMDERATGWDWVGINFDDGSALMAFRMRNAGGVLWAGGTLRGVNQHARTLTPGEVQFTPRRYWLSPRTGTRYPVAWTVRCDTREFVIEPLMDDQENDTRLTTGAIYWEGPIRVLENGRHTGRGYLELTGYWKKISL